MDFHRQDCASLKILKFKKNLEVATLYSQSSFLSVAKITLIIIPATRSLSSVCCSAEMGTFKEVSVFMNEPTVAANKDQTSTITDLTIAPAFKTCLWIWPFPFYYWRRQVIENTGGLRNNLSCQFNCVVDKLNDTISGFSQIFFFQTDILFATSMYCNNYQYEYDHINVTMK